MDDKNGLMIIMMHHVTMIFYIRWQPASSSWRHHSRRNPRNTTVAVEGTRFITDCDGPIAISDREYSSSEYFWIGTRWGEFRRDLLLLLLLFIVIAVCVHLLPVPDVVIVEIANALVSIN